MVDFADLTARAGLPIHLDLTTGKLSFGAGVEVDHHSVRYRRDMLDVLAEPNGSGPDKLYEMYRQVGTVENRREAAARNLRYDLTVLYPGTIGQEFIKTKGHYHPVKPGTQVHYPEVYEVLHGQAVYLLQTEPEEGAGPRHAVLVRGQPGDKVIIPPGYGHITVNVGSDWLVMCNWVSDEFESLYEPMERSKGGAVYVLEAKSGHRTVINPSSPPQKPPFVAEASALPALSLSRDRPMYQQLTDPHDPLRFLTHPERLVGRLSEVATAWEGDV